MKKLRFLLRGLLVILILLSCLAIKNDAQFQQCRNELRFCINYLNNDTSQPPDSCCQPLDYVIKSIPECLCSLLSTVRGQLAEQSSISNVSRLAQALPDRCGHYTNPLKCVVGTPDGRSVDLVPNSVSSELWSSSSIAIVCGALIFLFLHGFAI
ncbi:lipid-transfer protein [Striga asiatica]|uniref:Lipid-transfer protein n=1 Tax=Striga asiatica TaxID=4170 RepID=A0A5A7P658_STRAF|nr:lipid-transfer protein [Striga asiatica]